RSFPLLQSRRNLRRESERRGVIRLSPNPGARHELPYARSCFSKEVFVRLLILKLRWSVEKIDMPWPGLRRDSFSSKWICSTTRPKSDREIRAAPSNRHQNRRAKTHDVADVTRLCRPVKRYQYARNTVFGSFRATPSRRR